MNASISIGSEINITLHPEEVSLLEHHALGCTAKVRETKLNERKIYLCIGKTENIFADMKSFPKGACFEEIISYRIIISPEGYKLLQRNNAICDRTGGPSRVGIYVR